MLILPTAVLHHLTATGAHYDWLLGDPEHPTGRLWTFRLAHSSREWAARGVLDLQRLPAHRRRYLTYQGPLDWAPMTAPRRDAAALTPGRGRVVRVDEGAVRPRLWAPRRMVLEVVLRHWRGEVELRQRDGDYWTAQCGG